MQALHISSSRKTLRDLLPVLSSIFSYCFLKNFVLLLSPVSLGGSHLSELGRHLSAEATELWWLRVGSLQLLTNARSHHEEWVALAFFIGILFFVVFIAVAGAPLILALFLLLIGHLRSFFFAVVRGVVLDVLIFFELLALLGARSLHLFLQSLGFDGLAHSFRVFAHSVLLAWLPASLRLDLSSLYDRVKVFRVKSARLALALLWALLHLFFG